MLHTTRATSPPPSAGSSTPLGLKITSSTPDTIPLTTWQIQPMLPIPTQSLDKWNIIIFYILNRPPTTVHNIVKRFWESGEISVRKVQGRKPLLNACDHRALRWYCSRNHHATMMDIATWAREYFGKSLSLNTVKFNLKLYYAKRKAFNNFAQKRCRVLWAQSHLRWTERQWQRVLSSDECTFQLVFGKNGRRILHAKDENDHPDCYQWKVQKPASVMVWGCISVQGWSAYMWRYHWCGCLCWNFRETYAAIKRNTFSRNSMPISARQYQASFCTSYNCVAS